MFLKYLKSRWPIPAALLLFALIFALVLSLYDMPSESVLYAGLLCASCGAFLVALSYTRWLHRCRALEQLRRSICVSDEGLPSPSDYEDELYQELVRTLSSERARLDAAADAERRDAADYYAMWAHQIKTPIAAMRLLLQQPELDRGSLEAELFRIEQYVGMVLGYLKLEGDSNDFVLRKRRLDDVVRGCVRKYARLFIIKKLPLNFEETRMTVLTDDKWLAFMIEQLLSNSLKYTSQGEIRIYADGKALVVEDSGIGISAEDLPRLGERGFTGYNGREDKKSTGLGLYLCRRVCAKLGHKLVIESTPDVGTRVKILFADSTMLYE
ncbi:MAG TPA: sensor histidine kinase [Candidatus Scatomorpha gallistercoris]|nr:sensor histidine kinase [Candidatus Scatomorpha gallistercoris]